MRFISFLNKKFFEKFPEGALFNPNLDPQQSISLKNFLFLTFLFPLVSNIKSELKIKSLNNSHRFNFRSRFHYFKLQSGNHFGVF